MTNPLNKRIPRELKSDFGKYTALFLFLSLTIFLTSGFLVADNSMKSAYDESFEKYYLISQYGILKRPGHHMVYSGMPVCRRGAFNPDKIGTAFSGVHNFCRLAPP